MEKRVCSNHGDLNKTPPLDSSISRLCGVSVDTFTDNDISLFVLDGLDVGSKFSDFVFKGSGLDVFSAHVDNTVDVESDILSTGGTELIRKAVLITTSNLDISSDVTVSDFWVVSNPFSIRISDLEKHTTY